MAGFTLDFAPISRDFGRSGYNGPAQGDFGRSGYNGPATTMDFGRSGYKKDGDDADDSTKGNKGRSGYNNPDDDE